MKKIIKCPDHSDKHASAVIFTRPDNSQWLHCLGCGTSRLYKEGEKTMNDILSYDDYNENDYGIDIKQCLNPIELLERFKEEKGIGSDTVKSMEGFITDEGYLGFMYGKGREVYRRLIEDNKKPRFINTGGNKGLMGDDELDCYNEVFLVEGITDYLSFKWNVKNNVVCSFGAEISDEQAYLLRNKTVFILFDKDFAGYKGSRQAAVKLKEYGAIPIILDLPDFKINIMGKVDVNLLIHRKKEEFKEWLDSSIRKYMVFDSEYLQQFQLKKPLKYFQTDIPTIKITEGLYVITGLPGVGKTTMGISMLDHFVRQGGSVLYCNYDLPKDQIISRIATRFTTKLSWSEIEANPNILNTDKNAVIALKHCLKSVKVMNKLTIDELRYCKKYYTHIIVDYLQRVPNTNNDQRVGLERIIDDLSDMASNEGTTIIGISRQSLNGNPFSGTAAIEYHAQGAMILNRTGDDIISCETIKNTRGEIGTTLFKIDYAHQRLTPIKLNTIAETLNETLWKGNI